MTFSQFVEVFDTPPLPIDWNNCSTLQGLALFGKEINKGGSPMPTPANMEKGCFKVGKQKYVIFVAFTKASKSYPIVKAIQSDEKLTSIIGKDMNVMEVNFYRITGSDLSYGVDKTGNVGAVFNTVLAGMREQARGKPIDIIAFDSWDTSRTRLYKGLVKKFAIESGFTLLDVLDIQTSQGLNSLFLLVNNKVATAANKAVSRAVRPQMAGTFV